MAEEGDASSLVPLPWPQAPPLLIVLSGPSGVGKDAILARMKGLGLPLHFTVTATTRPKRPGETDGSDYRFLSPATFHEMVQRGDFLEHAEVYGNLYGVPKAQVREALSRGLDVIIKADVQGARTLRKIAPEAVFIFLSPPSMEELFERLRQRHTEREQELIVRQRAAVEEMRSLPEFDYVVVNDHVDEAINQIRAIIVAERCRVRPRRVAL